MKKISFLLIIVVTLFSCRYSQKGSGHIITESRNLAPFTAVDVSNSIDVELQQGDKCEVIVEADDNIIKYIETETVGGELKINLKHNTSIRNGTMRVRVVSPQYNGVKTSASANVISHNTITNANKISIEANSSSEIELQLDAPYVQVDASSSANITLIGRTKQANVSTSSSSDVNMSDLKAETVDAEANSSSSLSIFASLNIAAKASSSADIRYKGGATNVQKNVSSSGSISND
jgi:Putative auto-transporter adhesin, head GIN domain